MKTKQSTCLFAFILMSFHVYALSIRQIVVSNLSNQAINISLDTEAVELYYFDSWQYEIDENTIIVEAFFIEGFGSTIETLNNNFEIPLNATQTQIYHLMVNVYYGAFHNRILQDFGECFFKTPFVNPYILDTYLIGEVDEKDLRFINPTSGIIGLSNFIENLMIHDAAGNFVDIFKKQTNLIDISNLSNGLYFMSYFADGAFYTKRIILRTEQ